MSYLIVSDIDHTLLNDRGELVAANARALAKARAKGAVVVLATARSYAGALPVYQELALDTPLICSNGTLVYDPAGHIIMAQAIKQGTSKQLVELFTATPHHWSVRVKDIAYLHPDFDTSRPPFDNRRYYRPVPSAALPGMLGAYQDVVSVSLFGEDLAGFYMAHDWRAMGLVAAYYPPSLFNPQEAVAVNSHQASKGEAVRWLQRHLGFSQLPVLAIGDSPADATMFPLGIGVAPANAAAEVKATADWLAPHCDDGAVAAALQRYVFASEDEQAGLEPPKASSSKDE